MQDSATVLIELPVAITDLEDRYSDRLKCCQQPLEQVFLYKLQSFLRIFVLQNPEKLINFVDT